MCSSVTLDKMYDRMYYMGVFTGAGDVGTEGYGLTDTIGTTSLGNGWLHNGKDDPVAAWTSKLNVSSPKATVGAVRSLGSHCYSVFGKPKRLEVSRGRQWKQKTHSKRSKDRQATCFPAPAHVSSHRSLPLEGSTHLVNPFWKCHRTRAQTCVFWSIPDLPCHWN